MLKLKWGILCLPLLAVLVMGPKLKAEASGPAGASYVIKIESGNIQVDSDILSDENPYHEASCVTREGSTSVSICCGTNNQIYNIQSGITVTSFDPNGFSGCKIGTLFSGGTVEDNFGEITTVDGGTVVHNNGRIEKFDGGTVKHNYGTIDYVGPGTDLASASVATVEINRVSGSIGTIRATGKLIVNRGTVTENKITIGTNYGTVTKNTGTIYRNEGNVVKNIDGGAKICYNAGVIDENLNNAQVWNNEAGGSISHNEAKVWNNDGYVVCLTSIGEVYNNQGTVTPPSRDFGPIGTSNGSFANIKTSVDNATNSIIYTITDTEPWDYDTSSGSGGSKSQNSKQRKTTESKNYSFMEVNGELIYGGLLDGKLAGTTMIPASAYPKFTDWAVKKLEKALTDEALLTDGHVVLKCSVWNSFSDKLMAAIQLCDKDVDLIYTAGDGNQYQITVPADAEIMQYVDENGYCGLSYLGLQIGQTPYSE